MSSQTIKPPPGHLPDPRPTLAARLQAVLRNDHHYKNLLECNKADAQVAMNVFQSLLNMPGLEINFRQKLIVAAQRLSTKSGLYPFCYELRGVVQYDNHPVASGGFADIYRGDFIGYPVCLKALRVYVTSDIEHVLKQFSKEAILWGQLLHPNVLPFYGLHHFQNQLCFVAPWMSHGDIRNYLKNNPGAPRRLLADDTAQGLLYLHQNGIVHGDVKGPNILVDDAGRACVSDFGISSVSDPEILAWTAHSSAASKGGSVRWQAPELFDMENDELVKNSHFSDVYAWACVCYEIFTENIPFFNISRDTAIALQVKLGKRPERPAQFGPPWQQWELSESIWALMQDCWKENPSQRPSLQEAVNRLRLELPIDRRPRGNPLPPATFRERVSAPLDAATVISFYERLLEVALDLSSPQANINTLPETPLPLPISYDDPSMAATVGANKTSENWWSSLGVSDIFSFGNATSSDNFSADPCNRPDGNIHESDFDHFYGSDDVQLY